MIQGEGQKGKPSPSHPVHFIEKEDKPMLAADSATPLYLQLKEILEKEILDGRLADGAKIPTENELMETYRVSRVTVRRAMGELAAQGLLVRRPGKGTFVSSVVMHNDLDTPQGWTATTQAQGYRPATCCTELTKAEGAKVEAVFGPAAVEGNTAGYRRAVRIRSLNGSPLVYEIDYFPGPAYDFLTKEALCGSVFALLRKQRQISHIYEKETVIRVVAAGREIAGALALSEGEAVVYTRTVYLDEAGAVVLLNEQYINSGKYEIRTGGHTLVLTG